MGVSFPPKVAFGIWTLSNICFLGHTRFQILNGVSIGSAVYAQMTAECPYTSQWDVPSPLKIASSHGGSEPQSNPSFPGPTPVFNPNGISIGSAVFAGLISVTD